MIWSFSWNKSLLRMLFSASFPSRLKNGITFGSHCLHIWIALLAQNEILCSTTTLSSHMDIWFRFLRSKFMKRDVILQQYSAVLPLHFAFIHSLKYCCNRLMSCHHWFRLIALFMSWHFYSSRSSSRIEFWQCQTPKHINIVRFSHTLEISYQSIQTCHYVFQWMKMRPRIVISSQASILPAFYLIPTPYIWYLHLQNADSSPWT